MKTKELLSLILKDAIVVMQNAVASASSLSRH